MYIVSYVKTCVCLCLVDKSASDSFDYVVLSLGFFFLGGVGVWKAAVKYIV